MRWDLPTPFRWEIIRAGAASPPASASDFRTSINLRDLCDSADAYSRAENTVMIEYVLGQFLLELGGSV